MGPIEIHIALFNTCHLFDINELFSYFPDTIPRFEDLIHKKPKASKSKKGAEKSKLLPIEEPPVAV